MGSKKANSRVMNGINKTEQPYSNQGTQLFFNQRPTTPATAAATVVQEAQEVQEAQPMQEIQPVQEISLQTTTDILLFAILQELQTHNMIELTKLKAEQEKEQKELQDTEEMQELDAARFQEVRSSMYL